MSARPVSIEEARALAMAWELSNLLGDFYDIRHGHNTVLLARVIASRMPRKTPPPGGVLVSAL
jgi:hypothetical protein